MIDDLVDVFYRPLVQPLGNLVILFAQAEASLLDLVAALKDVDEWQAQAVLKMKNPKEQVLALVRASSGFEGFDLSELLDGVEGFWADKERRNRYIHDEWFPLLDEEGTPAIRGLPHKKGSDVTWDAPTAADIWALARGFQVREHLFSHAAFRIRKQRLVR
ncbi:hypothetical protein [Bradyrhizobium quebecense]|uniref:Uncharacterized protein n=2 Tax=Bradyrhizobium quebecense TaxID=2748629 RepID=A0ACD3VA41_9BRAD|nr:hypothetical protein [Bradyrhizobium quebecense]UGY03268.1 hypothetical protein J4P68_0000350 [Bradyrhizobium quebecense]